MSLKNVKRAVSFIIAFAMILTLVPSVFAAKVEDFTDFPTGWSNEAMVAAVNNGLLNGRTETEIVPEGNLTRAEMVTIINRAFGATIEANITSYLDVPENAWYYHEIAKGVNMQTIHGDSDTIMRPEDAITREEVFAIIARALVLESDNSECLEKFTDGDDVSDWAKKYICPLVSRNYVNGDDTDHLWPHKNITREEFAQVMHNIIKTYFSEEGTYKTTGPDSTLIRKSGANLSNVTVEGDLILGDGVGYGTVTLTNVTIKGRLLCRGGEKAVKLINTTVGDKVVVKDVNGTVHFDNYRDEDVFDDINMITNATFLTRVPSSSGGSGRPKHKHNWSTEWSSDGTHHWHECLKAGCDITENSEKDGYGAHIYDDEHDEYCNTCNYHRTITPGHVHNWSTDWATDGTHHWHECLNTGCDITENSQKDGYGVHIFDDEHDAYCNTCNYYRDVTPAHVHNWSTAWTTNETHHWHECLNAGCDITENEHKDGYGVHIFDNDQDEYCNTCNHYREVTTPSHEHNWATAWTTDETHHWHECLNADCPIVNNSQKDGYGVHDYDDEHDEYCNTCNHHRDVTPPHVHDWATAWTTTETHHWHECLNAGCPIINNSQKDGYGIHIYDNDQDEYCNTCNHHRDVAPPPHVHNWSTDWSTDDSNHWHECLNADCDITENSQKDGYGVHIYDNDQDEYCNVCNYKRTVTPVEKYTVEFYNGMMKDEDPIATETVEKDSTLNDISVSIDDVYTDNGVTITGNEIIYNWVGKEIYNGTYTHEVAPEYIYYNEKDGANKWEVFTEDTVLDAATVGADKTLEVYYAYKNIALLLSNLVPIDVLNTISVNSDYNSQTRAADTFKVLLINSKDQIEIGKAAIEEKQTALYTLVGNKTKGMVTPEGIINHVPVDLKIVDVIPYADVEEAVLFYVDDMLEHGTEDDIKEVSPYIADADMDAYVASVMAARTLRDAGDRTAINSIIHEALDNTKNYQPYKDIMKEFESKKNVFNLNDNNKAYAKAIAYEVGSFTYEEIKPYLEAKGYGTIIKLIGKDEHGNDLFGPMFLDSRSNYSNDLLDLIDQVKADKTFKTTYTTSLTVDLDAVSIIRNLYDKGTKEAIALFEGNSLYKYSENDKLQDIVNIDWFNIFLKPTGDGRYQISDALDIYDALIDFCILADEAICWYGDPTNYPDSDYDKVKKELVKDINGYINNVMNIFDQITSGQPIGGKFTINDLVEKVDDLNNVVDALGDSSAAAYGDTLESVTDALKTILINLGEGNLPGGASVDTVNKLCIKLKAILNDVSNEEYDSVNAAANSKIKTALTKLDSMLDELDEDGTIRGKSIEGLLNKFSFAAKLFDQYGASFKKIVALMANADVDESDINIDSKWMIDVLFGADAYDRYTIDDIMEIAPDKFMTEVNDYTTTADETYIVDYYKVEESGSSVKAQRTIR